MLITSMFVSALSVFLPIQADTVSQGGEIVEIGNAPQTPNNGPITPPGVIFPNLGQCIATLQEKKCSGLTGTDRAICNIAQQNYCFELFDLGFEP
ncbi:hypothetical protein SAMN02745121_09088 [Nannocystis exedens]|uniref:Uncharacterized protein n=1 Tax=Nannocystis exedens TaxID=54 RepID=A0A1I2J050_9BACT|nr:hypothetical protein [Nannocystis exedens]PCC68460.1 hypothetical protein NAEX_01475 [Nannocystis exedens]SFF47368.1 hypothetical protein SAMN02745121_09088 [Nannocystis exedens]